MASWIDTRVSRRSALKMGLSAAGFALAAGPLRAEAIHTPAKGLVTREATLAGRDGLPYYLARPEGAGPFPGVVVIHEIFGLHEHIRDVARRFAHEGYLAVAPELYFRQGDVHALSGFGEILELVRSVPDGPMLDDLAAMMALLRGMPECTGKVGATGFCWGGGATWLFAAHDPAPDAGVAWYGRIANWGSGPKHPQDPIDAVDRIETPMLGLYGGRDSGIPVADVERMRAALTRRDVPHELVVYPRAGHAFFADYRGSYVEAAATDGWRRCLAWFGRWLG